MEEMEPKDSAETLLSTPFTVANILSLMRAPLALFYLISIPSVRVLVVFLAMATDIIDGYLARRYKFTTKIGAVLDPLMDKFFVFFIMGILLYEGRIHDWQILSMLTRDFSIVAFGFYLFATGKLKKVKFQSVYAGKAMTALQIVVLFLLSMHIKVPDFVYYTFFFLGPIVLGELFFTLKSNPRKG